VLFGPFADHRKVGAQPLVDDVVGLPTKIDRSRTWGWSSMCSDHLGVVIGREEGLASPPSGIGKKPTKSVSQA